MNMHYGLTAYIGGPLGMYRLTREHTHGHYKSTQFQVPYGQINHLSIHLYARSP